MPDSRRFLPDRLGFASEPVQTPRLHTTTPRRQRIFLRPARHYSPKAKKPQRLTIPLVQLRRALWRRVQMQELSTARVPSCGLRRLVLTNPECDRFARQPPAGTYFRRVSPA